MCVYNDVVISDIALQSQHAVPHILIFRRVCFLIPSVNFLNPITHIFTTSAHVVFVLNPYDYFPKPGAYPSCVYLLIYFMCLDEEELKKHLTYEAPTYEDVLNITGKNVKFPKSSMSIYSMFVDIKRSVEQHHR